MAGFINSTPGYKGGYILAKPAQEIIINDVLKALGGQLFDNEFCQSHSGALKLCSNSVDCSARSLWQMIQFAVDQLLNEITLHHLVSSEPKSYEPLEEIMARYKENTIGRILNNQQ